jgi:hypothetical protein
MGHLFNLFDLPDQQAPATGYPSTGDGVRLLPGIIDLTSRSQTFLFIPA